MNTGTPRLIARVCLFLGAITMLAGLVMTIFSAYMVWRQTDSAPDHPDSAAMEGMKTFFNSMNHLAAVSVGIAILGMALFLGASLALSCKKKA